MVEKGGQDTGEKKRSRRLVPLLIVSCAVNVALGLGMVLISIERTELGYGMRRLEGMAKERVDHANELEVERGRLLSPYALEQKALEFGMRPAKPGQIRRMDGVNLDNAHKLLSQPETR